MKKLIGGNFKLNYSHSQIVRLSHTKKPTTTEIVIAVPYTHLHLTKSLLPEFIKTGAQNCSVYNDGPYTGEVSANLIKDSNAEYVIIGHSERRNVFKETDEEIKIKIKNVFEHGLKVILCVGETLNERKRGIEFDVVGKQLNDVLVENKGKIVDIAYEPVWAIGTGIVAKNNDIKKMIDFIRKEAEKNQIQHRVLYGGSVNIKNVDELLLVKGLDGFLVGNGSLNEEFLQIIAKLDSN